MGAEVLNRSFLSQNLTRAYPLVDWGTRLDQTGAFRLSDDLLVELYFPVGPGVSVDPGRFYIKSVAVFATGASIVLAYNDGAGADVVAGTASVARSALGRFTPVTLRGVGPFASSVGKLVVGQLDGVDAQGAGRFVFSPAATPLDVDCIRPQLTGVASIGVVDAGGAVLSQTGDVRLALGANMSITVPSPGTFQLNAIQGAGLTASCDCAGAVAPAAPVTSIQGIPSDGGAFTLVGDTCLEVSQAGSAIQLRDRCSSPCCGCREKEALQRSIDGILDQLRTLRDFQNRLQVEVNRFNGTVLASKVVDGGANCS